MSGEPNPTHFAVHHHLVGGWRRRERYTRRRGREKDKETNEPRKRFKKKKWKGENEREMKGRERERERERERKGRERERKIRRGGKEKKMKKRGQSARRLEGDGGRPTAHHTGLHTFSHLFLHCKRSPTCTTTPILRPERGIPTSSLWLMTLSEKHEIQHCFTDLNTASLPLWYRYRTI